ncbi:hypothetical protein FJZ40_00045 [Candidatus Shapirobacteria bacterium]|nr:hypothetical protein [Candidatus Shapirobacteria bacterium]
MIEKSPAIEQLLYQYTHLPIGGKKIRCPYWMDKIKKGICGPSGGKGSPEQIVEATLMAAKKEGINLDELSTKQIKAFMKRNRIGIDCSGLAFNLLNVLDKEKGGKGLAEKIPGAKGKFLVRANVRMLTDRNVSMPVSSVSDIKIGDMIRLRGGRHIAVVAAVKKSRSGKITEITYTHSSPKTAVSGVHSAKIKVKDEARRLENQEWLEETKDDKNYGKFAFSPLRGDGVRRFKL